MGSERCRWVSAVSHVWPRSSAVLCHVAARACNATARKCATPTSTSIPTTSAHTGAKNAIAVPGHQRARARARARASTCLFGGQREDKLAVEPAGSSECRVDVVDPVRRPDDDDLAAAVQPVHHRQQRGHDRTAGPVGRGGVRPHGVLRFDQGGWLNGVQRNLVRAGVGGHTGHCRP